ncbi:MAG TPA: hypothetical protein VD903_22290 [Pseudonocardia sp.]|nr:hypothetical protein [Pseudonocardia sp.]
MRRVLDVARIQTINPFLTIGLPLVVLGLVLLLNLATFAVIGGPSDGDRTTGALLALYVMMGIAPLQTMTQLFPFALGLGVTRRTFYAATALVVVAQSAVYGLVIVIASQVEASTGGWGLGLRFFGLPFLPQGNIAAQWLAVTVPMVVLASIGVFVGVVFKRWGQLGVYGATIGGAALLTGLALLVTGLDGWPAVGGFLASQPPLALLAGYPLLIALLFGGTGWLVLRRATA